MENDTKPFNLQAPEAIAKEYGGNKQKIAEAAQRGLLDPTAAVLAGMFIDRMRAAQTQEQVPQQTIAQQVMAPPPPPPPGMAGIPSQMPAQPMGLGATQEAAAMGLPAPMMPQGDPAMMASPMVSPTAPPQAGLEALPVPDGDYAEGGLVAFAQAGPVILGPNGLPLTPEEAELLRTIPSGNPLGPNLRVPAKEEEETIYVTARRPQEEKTPPPTQWLPAYDTPTPPSIYGMENSVHGNNVIIDEEAPLDTEKSKKRMAELQRIMDPEERKRRRKEDMWMTLGQIGAKMATTPGSVFQAFGAGMNEALPGAASRSKERREDVLNAAKELAAEERAGNKDLFDRLDKAILMTEKYGGYAEAIKDRSFKDYLAKQGINADLLGLRMQMANNIQTGRIAAGPGYAGAQASIFNARAGREEARLQHFGRIYSEIKEAYSKDADFIALNAKSPPAAKEFLLRKAREFSGVDPSNPAGLNFRP